MLCRCIEHKTNYTTALSTCCGSVHVRRSVFATLDDVSLAICPMDISPWIVPRCLSRERALLHGGTFTGVDAAVGLFISQAVTCEECILRYNTFAAFAQLFVKANSCSYCA